MRGEVERQVTMTMLSVVSPEHWIPVHHPIRRIEARADAALTELSPVFDADVRPSVPTPCASLSPSAPPLHPAGC